MSPGGDCKACPYEFLMSSDAVLQLKGNHYYRCPYSCKRALVMQEKFIFHILVLVVSLDTQLCEAWKCIDTRRFEFLQLNRRGLPFLAEPDCLSISFESKRGGRRLSISSISRATYLGISAANLNRRRVLSRIWFSLAIFSESTFSNTVVVVQVDCTERMHPRIG